MKTIRVLILEDDLETLSLLLSKLDQLEKELAVSETTQVVAVTVLSEYTQVEDYLNKIPEPNFNLILLDRDCKVGGSFHTLDFQRFGVDRIISISSIPSYNQEAQTRGVQETIWKDYQNLDLFSEQVIKIIKKRFRYI